MLSRLPLALAVLLALAAPVQACSWTGPEGWARLDMSDWGHETHQMQGLMADGACQLETPFDIDGSMVWIDDGYDRTQVGIDDGGIRVVAVPGEVIDVAVHDGTVYASVEVAAQVPSLPAQLRLMRWQGDAWVEHGNQPPAPWRGSIDGPHAVTRGTDAHTMFDYVRGRLVSVPPPPTLGDEDRYLGFDEGTFWYWQGGGLSAIRSDGDWRVETPHTSLHGWATDGDTVVWQGYPDDRDGPVLWKAHRSDTMARVLAAWPDDAYLGDVALLDGDHLVVVAFGIQEWEASWRKPIVASTPPSDAIPIDAHPTPMPLAVAFLATSAVVALRRAKS